MGNAAMSRQKYAITEDDFLFARKYLSRKFHEDDDWFLGCGAEEDFTASERDFRKVRTAGKLNDWGERWLARSHWEQLKAAIRAARKRQRERSREGTKHVSLSWRAWSILHDMAERDGVTISDLIVSRLESEWAGVESSE